MATNNEEIIERKEGSPVATSCLVIAVVAIGGAIALQLTELAQIRAEYVGLEKTDNQVNRVKGDISAMKTTVSDILSGSLPIGDEAAKTRVDNATKRSEKIKKDAQAEADPNKESSAGTEPEESPEEPAEEPEAPAEEPEEPAEEPEAPAEEPAGEEEDPLGDI